MEIYSMLLFYSMDIWPVKPISSGTVAHAYGLIGNLTL
jgi:hypothetical protein